MKKICVVCGNQFIAKTNQAKYCCKKCANHSRFNQTLEERQESARIAKKRVLELYDSDLSVEEISKEVGKCPTFIHTTWREAGKPKRLTPYQRQVAELRRQGLCRAEIHVIPISKGGMHSWDNVKLAHHYCNTLKSNKVVSL